MRKRTRHASARVLTIVVCAGWMLLGGPLSRAQAPPMYRVDPFWPKPLPHKWIMQQVPTLAVGPDDHVWVFNRSRQIRPDENGASTNPPRTDCCIAGPAVLEFDPAGNLIQGWGGPGYVANWPVEQTINVDRESNVWISGTGRGESLLKFSRDGKLLKDFGHRPPPVPAGQTPPPLVENNQQTDVLISGVAGFDFDEDARELYVADTEFINKRILIFDMETGAFKRGWGGKGVPLSEIPNERVAPYDTSGPPPDIKEFNVLHCIHLSNDGLVYVCDRGNDRVQVFTKQGRFVSQFWIHPSTPARGNECGGPGSDKYGPCGTVFNVAFSPAPQQNFVFVADGANDKVWIVNRKTGMTVGSIGDNGRMAGQFHFIDGVAADSKGNIYTGEVETGKRVQKFVPVNSGRR
jgi:DNA-binding beta-propeller fold protein YncE